VTAQASPRKRRGNYGAVVLGESLVQDLAGLEPNAAYSLSAWAISEDGARLADARLRAIVPGAPPSDDGYRRAGDVWERFQAIFQASATGTVRIELASLPKEGLGVVFDDVRIARAPLASRLVPDDFGTIQA